MNIKILKANNRGVTETGWLHSAHSFSFANYYDPQRSHFGALRVLNDDKIKPGQGFSMHKHENMEIITILLKGNLRHEDSNDNGFILKPGDVQVMTAGSGIEHSEFNNSQSEDCEFLQIWIDTRKENLTPKYATKHFPDKEAQVVASGYKDLGLHINQAAVVAIMHGKDIKYTRANKESGLFVFVIEGEGQIEDETLQRRDSAEFIGDLEFKGKELSKVLVIEVPISSS